jgi:RNA 2',3'-cyclic 3'-phosphodiesterase
MHRLFVGIRPPAPVRERLLALMGGVSGARWQTDDQLHLTLRFVGEVDRHVAGDVHAVLGTVHQAPFEIAVSGVGAFERRGEPHTLWAGIAPQEPVKALNRKVEQALARAGLPPEARAFHPHVTLARLPRGAGSIRPLLEAAGGVSGPSFEVAAFCLFESRLTPEGAVYSAVERYPLNGSR